MLSKYTPPPELTAIHAPNASMKVKDFLTIHVPGAAPYTQSTSKIEDYLSPLDPNLHDIHKLLELGSPPVSILENLLENALESQSRSVLCPHVTGLSSARCPLFMLAHWKELAAIRSRQNTWRQSLASLFTTASTVKDADLVEIAHQAESAISELEWGGRVQVVFPSTETAILASYCTKEWPKYSPFVIA